jgi:protein required for attachment to host cells
VNKHANTTWILVARRDRATVYSTHAPGDALKVMSEIYSPPEREQHAFAAQLALHLEVSRCRRDFDRLVLIAAPRLLDQIRAELTDQTRNLIIGELTKEPIGPDDAELRRHLASMARD